MLDFETAICPVCGSHDNSKRDGVINCTNLECASNGGPDQSYLPKGSEEAFCIVDPSGKVWGECLKFNEKDCISFFVHEFGAKHWGVHLPMHVCYGIWRAFEDKGFKLRRFSLGE